MLLKFLEFIKSNKLKELSQKGEIIGNSYVGASTDSTNYYLMEETHPIVIN